MLTWETRIFKINSSLQRINCKFTGKIECSCEKHDVLNSTKHGNRETVNMLKSQILMKGLVNMQENTPSHNTHHKF